MTNLAEIEIPHPTRYKKDRHKFFRSTFQQNLENLKKTYQIIREFNQAPIILSVSPVPLYATFSSEDVTVANCLSKSILRAVASELATQYDDVHYFPSFEMVMYSMDPKQFMKEDGRHVSDEGVSKIMEYFLSLFSDSSLGYLKKEVPQNLHGVDSADLKSKVGIANKVASKINYILKPLGVRVTRL